MSHASDAAHLYARKAHAFDWCVGLRTETKKMTVGRWSRVLRDFLNYLFFSSCGFSTAGVPITLRGTTHVLFASLHALIADAEGLAEGLEVKGAAGIRPCAVCDNVVALNSDLVSRTRGHFVEISCSRHSDFKRATPLTVGRSVNLVLAARRRLAAGAMTKAALQDIEKSTGLSATPHGVLACERLRPILVAAHSYDWVHCVLSSGTLHVEINALIALRLRNLNWATLEAAFSLPWSLPSYARHHAGQLYKIFRTSGASSEGKLKCSCGELLGIYAILRHILTAAVKDVPPMNLASFCACCSVVDVIMAAKASRNGDVASKWAAELLSKITQHMDAHKRAYGTQLLLPKHHYLYHVPQQLQRDNTVIDLFTLERLHLQLKRPAEKLRTHESQYAESLMRARLAAQAADLRVADEAADCLLGKQVPLDGPLHGFVARSMDSNGVQISVGDVVICREKHAVGRVTACVMYAASTDLHCFVDGYVLVERLAEHSTAWRATGAELTWKARTLELPKAWYVDGSADCLVVVV